MDKKNTKIYVKNYDKIFGDKDEIVERGYGAL